MASQPIRGFSPYTNPRDPMTTQYGTDYSYRADTRLMTDPLQTCWRCTELQYFANYGNPAAQQAACASICTTDPRGRDACPINVTPQQITPFIGK